MVKKSYLIVVFMLLINMIYAEVVLDTEKFKLEINGEIGAQVLFKFPFKTQAGKNMKPTWHASIVTDDIDQSKITIKPIYKISDSLYVFLEKDFDLMPFELLDKSITLGIGGPQMFGDFTFSYNGQDDVDLKYELAKILGIEGYFEIGIAVEDTSNPDIGLACGISYEAEISDGITIKPSIEYETETEHHAGVYALNKYNGPLPWKQNITFGFEFVVKDFYCDISYRLDYKIPIYNDKPKNSPDFLKERDRLMHTLTFGAGYNFAKYWAVDTNFKFIYLEAANFESSPNTVVLDKNRINQTGKYKAPTDMFINWDIGILYKPIDKLSIGTYFKTQSVITLSGINKDGTVNETTKLPPMTVPQIIVKAEYKF